MKIKKSGWFSLLVTALVLASCSAGGATEKSEGSGAGTTAPDQKISISVPTELVSLDTLQTTDKNTFTIAQQLFEGLYRLDENSQPVPGLAKEEAKVSDDGLTYTFKLRDDAKWSNGEKITAADFVFAWQSLVNPKTAAPNAYLLDGVKNGREIRTEKLPATDLGVKALAPDEFQVELVHPQPSFLTLISIVWLAPQNQAFVEAQGDKYGSDGDHLLFSGPFKIQDWTIGGDTWTLVPNKEYYAAADVKLTEISGRTMKEENTGLSLFNAGELDLTKISGNYVAEYTGKDSFVSHADIANTFLDFNKKEGTPLANVHLRKAIALAIDKESLALNTLNDGAKPLNGLIPKNLFTDQKSGTEFREFSGEYLVHDKEKAKTEWEAAKKELGDKLEISLLASDDDSGKKIAEYIQSQLQENLPGLTIKVQNQPKNIVNQSRRDKNYELSVSGWIAGNNDLSMYFILYETGSAYNYGNYSNPAYDKLVLAAKTTDANDVEKSLADYKAAEEILLNQDAAQVPLIQSSSNYLVNPKLKGVAYPAYGNYFGFRNAYIEE